MASTKKLVSGQLLLRFVALLRATDDLLLPQSRVKYQVWKVSESLGHLGGPGDGWPGPGLLNNKPPGPLQTPESNLHAMGTPS